MASVDESSRVPSAEADIRVGDRFGFGENWSHFLDLVDDERIRSAERSLQEKLGEIQGLTLVDAGSGSGLFSLAARNLGAKVVSFDFDPQSVACTEELRARYRANDEGWIIRQGSVLDLQFLKSLGKFELVYSWGVLHHTGDMWLALANAAELVAKDGRLFIAIYNDQGRPSRIWTRIKRLYNRSGPFSRSLILGLASIYFRGGPFMRGLYRRMRHIPRELNVRPRGMDRKRDLVDWVGGWPFEVAKPEEIFSFFRERGFVLDWLSTCAGGLGCNEFVFARKGSLAHDG